MEKLYRSSKVIKLNILYDWDAFVFIIHMASCTSAINYITTVKWSLKWRWKWKWKWSCELILLDVSFRIGNRIQSLLIQFLLRLCSTNNEKVFKLTKTNRISQKCMERYKRFLTWTNTTQSIIILIATLHLKTETELLQTPVHIEPKLRVLLMGKDWLGHLLIFNIQVYCLPKSVLDTSWKYMGSRWCITNIK